MTRGPYVGRGILGIMLIIALGVALAESDVMQGSNSAGQEPRLESTAFMSAINHRNTSGAFGGGEVAAVMGQVEVDLRETTMAGDEVVIEVDVLMGQVALRIPDNWMVVSEMDALMGFANIRAARPEAPDGAPRLILRGGVLMGELVVRN